MNNSLPDFVGPGGLDRYRHPRKWVALDFETTNLSKGSALDPDNKLVLACWDVVTPEGMVRHHKFGDEYEMRELEQDIKDADFIVAHNAKFELQWLKRCGLDLREILVFDTMLAEWVIGGNRYNLSDLGLEASASRYRLGSKLTLAGMMIKAGVCPSTIPKAWLLSYCSMDTELCRKLFEQQGPLLDREKLLHLALVRNLACACLADIEFNGAELDKNAVLSAYDKAIQEYQTIEQELAIVADGTNLSSPKQRAALLFEKLGFQLPIDPRTKEPYKTNKGAISTTADIIGLLTPKNDTQRTFLQLYLRRNKLAALLSKNLEFFKGIVEEKGGRFFAVLNQGFTKTHRLSSSGLPIKFKQFKMPKGVQFQNLPRELKSVFTALDEDYLVGEADGAQLEFRVAAQMGRDAVAREEIITGADIHSSTAKVLTEAGEPAFVKADPKSRRQLAKPQTFAPLNIAALA